MMHCDELLNCAHSFSIFRSLRDAFSGILFGVRGFRHFSKH